MWWNVFTCDIKGLRRVWGGLGDVHLCHLAGGVCGQICPVCAGDAQLDCVLWRTHAEADAICGGGHGMRTPICEYEMGCVYGWGWTVAP